MKGKLVLFLCNCRPAILRGIKSDLIMLIASTSEKIEILRSPHGTRIGDEAYFEGYKSKYLYTFLKVRLRFLYDQTFFLFFIVLTRMHLFTFDHTGLQSYQPLLFLYKTRNDYMSTAFSKEIYSALLSKNTFHSCNEKHFYENLIPDFLFY